MIQEVAAPTLVAEGSRFQGDISFFSETYIFGLVEGDLYQQSFETLHVGQSGWVHGKIVSRGPIIIEGKVEGNIYSTGLVRLTPTSIVRGEIKAPKIEIQPGARVDGTLACKAAPMPV